MDDSVSAEAIAPPGAENGAAAYPDEDRRAIGIRPCQARMCSASSGGGSRDPSWRLLARADFDNSPAQLAHDRLRLSGKVCRWSRSRRHARPVHLPMILSIWFFTRSRTFRARVLPSGARLSACYAAAACCWLASTIPWVPVRSGSPRPRRDGCPP